MKKPTIFKVFIAAVFILLSISSHAQLRKGFTPRKATSLNGDILVIGNNILNRETSTKVPKDPYNDIGDDSYVNDEFNMKYIDIDTDNTTKNSSSATLTIPKASETCYEIVYAALYWGGTYQGTDRKNINKVKLKTPEAGAKYKELTGDLMWDEGAAGVDNAYVSKPYACYVEITDEVKTAKQGVYTIADVICSEGKLDNGRGGNSAGWSIFIIYKDPLLPNKYITSFDGFSIIRATDGPLDIPISGFRTNPFGDVNVKLAFSALEGDNRLKGDGLEIKGAKSSDWGAISSLTRPIEVTGGKRPKTIPNFFNSSITDGDVILGGRVPSSINTLGYDAGVVKVDNKDNKIIQNDETNATLRISTSSDSYYMFFNALSVEIIAPKIVLRKNVLDKDGKNINGQPVTLSQELQYEIKFKNEGNDSAKNFTITDILPKNVIFGGLSSMTMDSRITATYDEAARKLVFTIPDALVVTNGPLDPYTIKFKVKVVDDCNELIDACANKIENTAYSKYYGVKNTSTDGFGEGSYSTISACNVGEPTATNFLVGIDKCLFSRDVSLCGTTTLTAALGYNTYVWRDPNGLIFGGNNRIVTITKPGKYTVNNSGAENCEPIQQTFNVTDYLAATIKNPIKGDNIDPETGEAFACVRDKKPFPKIFLCGLNDKREIDTGITGATKVTWQETKDVPSKEEPNPENCPFEGAKNWTTVVENNTKFIADREGVFRVVVNYGNTCFVTHYFNVYQNNLDPIAEKQDIICGTKGSITVTNPPQNSGYLYSLNGVDYQPESTFNDVPKGSYKVQIRQTVLIDGQISKCPFYVDVNVEELEFKTDLKETNPICTGDLGTITASIANVPGNYKFILRKKGTTAEIQNTGFITDNFVTFKGVEPGFMYEVIMSTAKNGCNVIKEIEVLDYRLTAEAKVTKTLSACGNGEIQVTVKGGTPRPGPPAYYMYYINGNANYVTDPKIVVTPETLPADGIFNIEVVDAKGCSVMLLPVTMIMAPKPVVKITPVNIKCYGYKTGQLEFEVTPADSGYDVSYSIDGTNFNTISPISNLAAGDYNVIVKYTYDKVECVDPAVKVTISEPTTELTASAGVSELAGCGAAGEGKIRITNPQGGVEPYTYSFDDQKTWVKTNDAYKDPGTYTVYIKDDNGCIYSMSGITIELPPVKPEIEVKTPVNFNCDGSATSTVTVKNPGNGNFEYNYYLDNSKVANTNNPPNVFPNVASGDHSVRVEYKLVTVPTFSNLLMEDFGYGGDVESPGINKDYYCFERQVDATKCRGSIEINDGDYSVTARIVQPFGPWLQPGDHTPPPVPAKEKGRCLVVNIGDQIPVTAILYEKTIKDIIPNQPINVEYFAFNLLNKDNGQADPDLIVGLMDMNGNEISSFPSGRIPKSEKWEKYPKTAITLDPGNNTTLRFIVRSNLKETSGNDVAIDDIRVYQLPKSCKTTVDIPFTVPTGKGFTASAATNKDVTCATGAADGEVTITASNFNTTNGYEYSTDGGLKWTKTTISPLIVKGFSAGTYDVRMRYDDTAEGSVCVKTSSPNIKAPEVIIAAAVLTTPAKCSVGATITASAKGGSGTYEYELRYVAGGVYRIFQKSGEFLDVAPGDYFVFVKDNKDCVSPDGEEIKVDKSPDLTAELDIATDYCYDTVDKATLVVKASGGTGTFSYSLDKGTGQKSNIFKNVEVGLHKIIVTDDNGCSSLEISITIEPELKVTPSIKALDCSSPTTKDAIITGTITGGYLPFTITKVSGPAGGTLDGPSPADTGRSFTYTTSVSGDYEFEIKDKQGCTKTLKVKIDPITDPTLKETSKTNVSCKGKTDGAVVLTGEKGSGGYKFSDDGTTFTNTTGIFSGLAEGLHTFYVKDSKGCIGKLDVTIAAPVALAGSAVMSPKYTCDTKAVITATATDGNGSYTYVLKRGTTTVASNTDGKFIDLTVPGTYTVDITDGKGCPLTVSAGIIEALTPPTAMIFSNTALKCPSNKVDVTIESVTGGKGALQYRIVLPTASQTLYPGSTKFTDLAPGTYTFEVKDENNCTKKVEYTIDKLPEISINSTVDNTVICKEDSDGKVTFTIGGFGNETPYSYIIDGDATNILTGTTGPTGTTFDITVSNLNTGNHSIEVTNGTTNCKVSKDQLVAGPLDPLVLTPATVTPKTCAELGTATIKVTGGWNTNYTYTVTTPLGAKIVQENDNYFANLEDGLYNYAVKDLKGCEETGTFTIGGIVAITASITASTNLCYKDAAKAAIYVTPDTHDNYVYSINGLTPQNNGTFTGLAPGKYKIRVTDTSTGCYIDLAEQTVTTELTANTNLFAGPKCNTLDVVITGKVSGGTPGYTYAVSIDGTPESPATTHTITAADGTFTYTDGSGIPAGKTTATVYVFTFTDSKGCTTTATRTVQPKTNPQFTATPNSTIFCNGQASGSITVTIDTDFGEGPYVTSVINTSTTPVTSYGTQTTGLPAGNYTVRVTDAKGCFDEKTEIIIKQPDPIVVDYKVVPITCVANGVSLGRIIINTVDGGTKNYTYNVKGINYDQKFDNKDGSTQFFEIVNFGYYEIIITDANGCSKIIKDILVASPPDDLDITVSDPSVDCSTGGKAVVAVGSDPLNPTRIVGNGPFYFAIYDGSVPNYPDAVGSFAWLPEDNPGIAGAPGDKKATFTNLTPGVKYTFIVYDSDPAHGGTGTGCYYFETSEDKIPTNSKLKVEGDVEAHNITCFTTPPTADGNVSFKISSEYTVATDVDYQIFNELTLQPMGPAQPGIVPAATVPVSTLDITNFGALPFGKYIIVITEIKDRTTTPVLKGCSIASIPFTITGSVTPLTLDVNSPNNANYCNTKAGKIEAFAQGGTTLEADPDPINPKPAIPYLYQIKIDEGAIGEDVLDMRPTAASFDLASHKPSVFNVEAGNYLVYVRDAYGCIAVKPVTVDKDPEPVITAVLVDQCNTAEGKYGILVTLTTTGIGTHSYSLDGGEFEPQSAKTFTIPNVSSGEHTVSVKDANGCGNTVIDINIYAPLEIEGSFTTPPTCRNADGIITVDVKGGFRKPATNFEYTLVNNTTGVTSPSQANNPEFIDQAAGNYTVTVTDIKTGCTKDVTIDLVIPLDPDFSLANTAPNCAGSQGILDNGTITVTMGATNTDIPYTYTLNKISPTPLGTSKTQNGKLFTELTAGVYEVTVTSAKTCPITKRTEILAPTPVTITLSQDDFKCTDTTFNDKIVTVTPGGGAGAIPMDIKDYKYSTDGTSWQDENTFTVIDNGFAKTLTYYVKDAKGCIVSDQITIDPFPKLISVIADYGDLMDCVNNKQEMKVTITGGTNTPLQFTYQAYENGVTTGGLVTVTGNTFIYNALKEGATYKFEVFDNNTTCSLMSTSYEVPVFNKINVAATAFAMVDCNTNATGQIEINVVDYAGPYTYEILKGGVSLTPPVSGVGTSATTSSFVLPDLLPAGTYTVFVKETAYPGCDFTTDPVTITEPDALTGFTVTNVNKNCFNAGSRVSIDLNSIFGGSGGNSYAFVKDNESPLGKYGPDSVAILDPATSTEWDVWVKDKNDCAIKLDVTIAEDLSPYDLAVNAFSQCPSSTGTYTFIVTATTAGGAEYSIGNGFQPTGTFTVDAAGEYFVTVRDKNGCTNDVPFKVTILEELSLKVKAKKVSTCNNPDGEITVEAQGGSTDYEYSKDDVTYGPSPTFTLLLPNTYKFYVRDRVTGCKKMITEIIENATPITGFALTPTPVTCFGSTDGTITATMTAPSAGVNDNPKYMYSIDGGLTSQESNVFKDLAAGPYTITVTSGRGCFDLANTIVGTPAIITVPVPTVVPFGCTAGTNDTNFATITVNVAGITGGSNDYKTFEFIKVGTPTPVYKGSDPFYTEYDLAGGSYTINVYDSKGCIGTAPATVEIKPFIGLDLITVDVTKAITCNNLQEIQVSVSHTGATAPTNLEYTLVDVNATDGTTGILYPKKISTDGKFIDLPVANYLVTVTNLDTKCGVKTYHYVNDPNTFDLTIDKIVNVTCFAGNNGSANVTIVDRLVTTTPLNPDEAGPFDYKVFDAAGIEVQRGNSPTAGPVKISNLTAGTYKITATLTGTPFCSVSKNFKIDQPTAALDITEKHSEITCLLGDGKISVTATGGWPSDYVYELRSGTDIIKPYGLSPDFTGLTNGTYQVYVKDFGGCEDFVPVVLNNPMPIAITISATLMLTCFDNEDGVVTINTVTGGSGNYTYTLHGVLTDGSVTVEQSQGAKEFTGLKAGTYYVTANDTWNCTNDSNKVTINQPEIVKASLTIQRTESCTQVPVVRLTATGGTGQYYYSADGSNYTGPFSSFVDITLPVTTTKTEYKYFVKDANNCRSYVSNFSAFSPVPELEFERSSEIDIKCKGGATGSITVSAKGGLGNYVYTLQNAAGIDITPAPAQGIPGMFTELPIGNYIVKITSLDCSTVSTLFQLTEPDTSLMADAIATPLTCNGYNNGTITVNANGGVGKYKYAIEPEFRQFFDKNVFENLKPGFYDVLVQDENECYVFLKDIEVKEPAPLLGSEIPNSMIPEVCVGDKNGAFAIQITGGTAPYTASLDNDKGPFLPVDGEADYTGLSGGKHIVYIIDASGCSTEVEINMPLPVILNPTVEVNYDCVNNGQTNMVTVTVDNSNTDLTQIDYSLDATGTYQPGNIFTNVAPGRHTITARHTNGCEIPTASFDIKAYDPLTLAVSGGKPEMNIISVTAGGGAPAYEYSFNGEPFTSSNRYKIYKSGDYVVVVRDKNGCTATITVPAVYIDVCLDNYFTPAGVTNTTWGPGCTNIYNNLEFSIFDRYGRVIVKYHYGQKWDGRYNGADLPSGDYWYVLKLNDPKDDREFVGHFTLYR
ncbi:T9SS type B sorting domain-containing protein [Flavobacterium sp. NPDC079362]|uniref:T9SS type B sorting domain-containing protein n=1 Tax=Flavobacterium sp. NPDC079362 TaxID=3390566 RepID=UPI003D03FE4A